MKIFENHEDQPKIVKNHNIKNIINDGQVRIMVTAVQKTTLQKKIIAITAPQKFDHRSSLHSGLRIGVACAAFSKSHAKHLVNRDYETLLLGDFG